MQKARQNSCVNEPSVLSPYQTATGPRDSGSSRTFSGGMFRNRSSLRPRGKRLNRIPIPSAGFQLSAVNPTSYVEIGELRINKTTTTKRIIWVTQRTTRSAASALSCTSGGIGARPLSKPHRKRTTLKGSRERKGHKTSAEIGMRNDILGSAIIIVAN